MRTVAFLNKKGGVGKTSACHHLSGALARKGLRVLLVNADPQASLSQGLLGPEVARGMNPTGTIAAIFDDAGGPPIGDLVLPTPIEGVSILPGSEAMEDLNVTRPWETGPLQFALRDALGELAAGYDLALIDCPPSVQLASWSTWWPPMGSWSPSRPRTTAPRDWSPSAGRSPGSGPRRTRT